MTREQSETICILKTLILMGCDDVPFGEQFMFLEGS